MRQWAHIIAGVVVLAIARASLATELTWGAYETNGVGLADGSQLTVGNWLRIGTFTISETEIRAHAADIAYLEAHFVQFGSAHVGDGDVNGDAKPYAGHWLANDTNSTVTRGIARAQIYYWLLDSTTSATATQFGIFTAPGNPRWSFPDDTDVPSTTITDISDVPHDSTGCIVGSYGAGTSVLSGSPLYNLAALPAPTPTPTPTPTATPTATPTVTQTPRPTPIPTATVTVTPTPTPIATATPAPTAASQLLNLSARKMVGKGADVTIGGFILAGTDNKTVLIRGLGPSLPFGTSDLADPTVELHQADGTLLYFNNNWKDTQAALISATGIPPTNDLEAAILFSLPAKPASSGGAAYTAILAGNNDATGEGLIEFYDLAQSANSKLANISTRGFVGTDPDVLVGGFIPGPRDRAAITVLVRALGPSLTSLGVSGALQDPVLELHDANGNTLVTNDDWKQAPNVTEIAATLPPADDRESAILVSLPPAESGYTAVVRGAHNTNGVALVEIYALQ